MEIHTALLLLFVYAAKRLILRRVPPARRVPCPSLRMGMF